LIDKFYMDDP